MEEGEGEQEGTTGKREQTADGEEEGGGSDGDERGEGALEREIYRTMRTRERIEERGVERHEDNPEREMWEKRGWKGIELRMETLEGGVGRTKGRVDVYDEEDLEMMAEMEAEKRDSIERDSAREEMRKMEGAQVEEGWDPGEGGRGGNRMLGRHVFLRQAEVGVGEVMQRRKKMKGRRRVTKEETEKKRVNEQRQASFMDSWKKSQKPGKNLDPS